MFSKLKSPSISFQNIEHLIFNVLAMIAGIRIRSEVGSDPAPQKRPVSRRRLDGSVTQRRRSEPSEPGSMRGGTIHRPTLEVEAGWLHVNTASSLAKYALARTAQVSVTTPLLTTGAFLQESLEQASEETKLSDGPSDVRRLNQCLVSSPHKNRSPPSNTTTLSVSSHSSTPRTYLLARRDDIGAVPPFLKKETHSNDHADSLKYVPLR